MAGTPDRPQIELSPSLALRHLGPKRTIDGERQSSGSLLDRVALITGASSGIGKATAERLAIAGADLIIHGRNEVALAQLSETLTPLGVKVVIVTGDIENPATSQKFVEAIRGEFNGRLNILFNNAGTTRDKTLDKMTEGDWDAVMNWHLKGAFLTTKAVVPLMIETVGEDRSGRIVNNSSISGLNGNEGQINYSTAKSGLIGFTKALAVELAPKGITVNAVAFGTVESPVWDRPRKAMAIGFKRKGLEIPEDPLQPLQQKMPLLGGNRLIPAEMAAAKVAFLVRDEALDITGQVLIAEAGFTQMRLTEF